MILGELRKLKDKAARAVEKRQYDKAAQLYLQIAEEEAGDPDWRQRAGEALRRVGDTARAMAQLELAAEAYWRRGFVPKAVAVCKTMLQLVPNHRAAEKLLAEIEARRAGRPTMAKHVGTPTLHRSAPPLARPPRFGKVGEPLIDGRGRAEIVGIEDRRRGYTPVAVRPEPPPDAEPRAAEPRRGQPRHPEPPPAARPRRHSRSFTIVDRDDSGAYVIDLDHDTAPQKAAPHAPKAPDRHDPDPPDGGGRPTRPGRKRRTTSR